MNIRLLRMVVWIGGLALTQSALAQLPAPRGPNDHPSHRYLPPPVGKGSIVEQVRALEQLSAANGTDEPSPFQLSPSQLKQLDSIVESFRNDKGELELPDPQSIPKQWIDSLVPDPKQRQQVKDVLEEYARTRNLQLDQDGQPNGLPPLESSGPGSGTTGPRTNAPRASRQTEDSRSANDSGLPRDNQRSQALTDNASGNAPGTDQVPQDKLAELRTLYETLKKIQEQRAKQSQQEATNSRWQASNGPNDRNRNANGPSRTDPRSDPRSGRPPRPNETARPAPRASGNNLRDRTDRMPGNNQPGSPGNQPGRLRAPPPLTEDDVANGLRNHIGGSESLGGQPGNKGSGSNLGDGNSASPGGTPALPSADPNVPALTPFDEGYNFSADQKVAVDPFAQPEDATADPNSGRENGSQRAGSQRSPRSRPAEPFQVTRMAQEPRAQPPSSNAQEPGFDLKRSIDQSGLGSALKRIVQKTLKEQGFDPNQPGNPLPGGPNSNAVNSQMPNSNLPGGQSPGPMNAEQLRNWANSVASAPNTPSKNSSSNNSAAPANSAWGKWVREVWQTMAEAPARSSSASSSRSSSSATSPGGMMGQLPEFRWTNSMTMAVIFVAGLVGLFIWLSRRRVAELADATAAQAEWVRTVMAQGLKTRADVVRAFHQLVKQSRAVSDWWTHRSIVKHFSSQTPQVAAAISELAIVYEQARYYPEDVELSQQQLAQVRTLLESVKIPTSNRA